tara:strand:+ start:66 stop:242 length:177 start_codon:yes stop_codon:yes gene_type:complete
MKEILEYIEEYPEHSKYVVDGEVQWEALGIDIELERKSISYVDDTDLFISTVSVIDFV